MRPVGVQRLRRSIRSLGAGGFGPGVRSRPSVRSRQSAAAFGCPARLRRRHRARRNPDADGPLAGAIPPCVAALHDPDAARRRVAVPSFEFCDDGGRSRRAKLAVGQVKTVGSRSRPSSSTPDAGSAYIYSDRRRTARALSMNASTSLLVWTLPPVSERFGGSEADRPTLPWSVSCETTVRFLPRNCSAGACFRSLCDF